MNNRWSWAWVIVAILIGASVLWYSHAQSVKCEQRGGVYARRWMGWDYECLKEQ